MPTIASHSPLNITETETIEIDAWFQRATNRKWHTGCQMINDVTWPRKVKLVPQYP